MRSIHFRVEDDLYRRIQEEAEEQDVEAWGEATEIIQDIERRDVAARAKLGRERRMGPTFTDKLQRERAAPPSE